MAVIGDFGFGQAGSSREDFLQVDHVIELGREPNRIDLLNGINGVIFDEAWDNREQGQIADVSLYFISRDLAIKNKRAANPDKDRGVIALLEKPVPGVPA